MVHLQGTWWQSRFHLWGERIEEPPSQPGRRSPARIPRHPGALTPAELRAAIGEVSPDGLLASAADEGRLTLWLPTRSGRPAASFAARGVEEVPAAAASSVDGGPTALNRFTVPTLVFLPADTVDLLVNLPRSWWASAGVAAGSPPGAILASSLRFWQRLARVALALLSRQQFVPDLVSDPDAAERPGGAARWRIYVAERPLLAWLERCAAAMPPVMRAVDAAGGAPLEATRMVDDFLLSVGDAVVRRSLSRDPFYEQLHRRAAEERSWDLCWLSALVGEDPTLRADPDDTTIYTPRVRAWLGRLDQEQPDQPPVLSFVLLEPPADQAEEHARWQVCFELRAEPDGEPLDLARVWSEDSPAPTILARQLVSRRQHLIAELRRAGSFFPALESALADGEPVGVALNTDEAHRFLHEYAPLLRAQGFTVRLPVWAERLDRRLGLELHVRPKRSPSDAAEVALGSFGLATLLEFDWRVAVGGQPVSLSEFRRMAASGTRLVRVFGEWIDLDHEAAQRTLAFLERDSGGELTLAEAIRLASGAGDLATGLPVLGLRGTDWIERFLNDAGEARIERCAQPETFQGELRPYQQVGLDWLAFLDRLGIGGCLADDMGLGKTIQLLALLLHERREGRSPGPTLLFAPMSVVGNWEREIHRFAPSLRVLVHHGPDRLVGAAFLRAAAEHDVVLTTYGLAQRDFRILSRVAWHRIALDEAQKIKNPSANQTIAIRSLRAPRRVALTGTPIENHLSELWSIMEVLNPGLLGPAAEFRARFAVPIEKLGDRRRAEQLRRLIRPFVLRRLKSDPDVLCDLPEKMEMRVYCNLTPEQAAHYERVVNELLAEVDSARGIRRRGLILAALTRLKQVCNHPSHLLRDGGPLAGRSGKCERLAEMLEEVLEAGDAALVFTQYREMGDLLQRYLQDRTGLRVPFLHGGTTAAERNRLIDAFQDPAGEERIFLLSLRAGGFGLNLTRANHVFHFDRWWNPAVEDQATDRAHRIGQTRRVQVHKFVCIGTIEDRIDQVLAEKAALADRIVGSGDEWLTDLSTAELRDILRLSRDAVAED